MGLIFVVFSCIFLFSTFPHDEYLRVDFLDIGQGDAVLITSPLGRQLLVDAGRDKTVLRSLGREMSFFDRDIDVILATHPDYDHIGGFPELIKRFDIDYVLKTLAKSNTATFNLFKRRINDYEIKEIIPERGMVIDLGSNVYVQVLFPLKNMSIDGNEGSVVAKVIYKETSFLLMGDTSIGVEDYLVEIDNDLESNVLKAGHHGSRTSSSDKFVKEVGPQHSVISAGKDNSYGHPHKEVLDILKNNNVEVLSTASLGTITFFSDGNRVWID